MNKLKFVPVNYWNKSTMTLSDSPTKEQWDEVEEITNKLNLKYQMAQGCRFHPDRVQKFMVGLFNDYIDIQIVKADTCMCHDIVSRMIEIRNDEMFILNPNHYTRKP